ncbi:MAG: ATPase, T2SS/T4P/T4SS family [Vulcanimicrobiaceae bacterium]
MTDIQQPIEPKTFTPEERRSAIAVLGYDWCRQNQVLPYGLRNRTLYVAHQVDDKRARLTISRRANVTKLVIEVLPPMSIHAHMQRDMPAKDRPQQTQAQAYIEDLILAGAEQHGSDITFLPNPHDVAVRILVDGIPRIYDTIDHETYSSTYTILATSIANYQKSIGQSGQYTVERDGRDIAVRIQTFPRRLRHRTVPQFILRLQQPSYLLPSFDSLGLTPEQQAMLLRLMSGTRVGGLVIGAPGSGKSTTIYAALIALQPKDKLIYSLESPVETEIAWISQSEITDAWTYEKAMRALLRSAPHFVFIGETFDEGDAGRAFGMSLAAVPCVTSFHGDNAAYGLRRLLDMDIPIRKILDGITFIVAQRLYNPACEECSTLGPPSNRLISLYESLNLSSHVPKTVLHRTVHPSLATSYVPSDDNDTPIQQNSVPIDDACSTCLGYGIVGPRRAIFEVCEMNAKLSAVIQKNGSPNDLASALYDEQHQPIFSHAARLLAQHAIDETTFFDLPLPTTHVPGTWL